MDVSDSNLINLILSGKTQVCGKRLVFLSQVIYLSCGVRGTSNKTMMTNMKRFNLNGKPFSGISQVDVYEKVGKSVIILGIYRVL